MRPRPQRSHRSSVLTRTKRRSRSLISVLISSADAVVSSISPLRLWIWAAHDSRAEQISTLTSSMTTKSGKNERMSSIAKLDDSSSFIALTKGVRGAGSAGLRPHLKQTGDVRLDVLALLNNILGDPQP